MPITNMLDAINAAHYGLADRYRIAYGSGALVTGTLTVQTGLNVVDGFFATLINQTGASASGVTEVSSIVVNTITTGAVAVIGSYNAATGVRIASASGTATFAWVAIGR